MNRMLAVDLADAQGGFSIVFDRLSIGFVSASRLSLKQQLEEVPS
jgi:hypothetical protein